MKKDIGNDLVIENGSYKPMGVSFDGKDTNVAVQVSGSVPVSLLLYEKKSQAAAAEIPFCQESRVGNILSMTLKDFDIRKYTYNFKINGEVCQDPYARRIFGREVFGSRKRSEKSHSVVRCGYVEDLPGEMHPIARPYDQVIGYSLHVRGYTKKIQTKARGTFAALQEKVPYFQELGVNLVCLMPCYEFEEMREERDILTGKVVQSDVGERKKVNYWGYGPGNYFAPKAAYSFSENPGQEFYQCVQAFHQAGIEVAMELFFLEDVSPKFMEEVVTYWVLQYGIDGFHIFSGEAGQKHLATVPLLGRTKLIFSYWNGNGGNRRRPDEAVEWKQIGVANAGFQVCMRSFLKGDYRKTEAAFWKIAANQEDAAIVNYMVNHDGFTLLDSLSYDYKHNEANGEENKDGSFENFSWNCGVEGPTRKRSILNLRRQMMQNAFTLLLLSQGTPFIYGGDELGNSQNGNNNAWCQDNEIGWVNWKTPKAYEGVTEFVKRLIAFRRKYLVFHQKMPLRMLDTLSCGYPDLSCHGSQPWRMDFENDRHALGLLYWGDYVNQPEGSFFVVYNMYWEEQEFHLPRPGKKRDWYLVLDTSKNGGEAFAEADEPSQAEIKVPARSIRVFQAKPHVLPQRSEVIEQCMMDDKK